MDTTTQPINESFEFNADALLQSELARAFKFLIEGRRSDLEILNKKLDSDEAKAKSKAGYAHIRTCLEIIQQLEAKKAIIITLSSTEDAMGDRHNGLYIDIDFGKIIETAVKAADDANKAFESDYSKLDEWEELQREVEKLHQFKVLLPKEGVKFHLEYARVAEMI